MQGNLLAILRKLKMPTLTVRPPGLLVSPLDTHLLPKDLTHAHCASTRASFPSTTRIRLPSPILTVPLHSGYQLHKAFGKELTEKQRTTGNNASYLRRQGFLYYRALRSPPCMCWWQCPAFGKLSIRQWQYANMGQGQCMAEEDEDEVINPRVYHLSLPGLRRQGAYKLPGGTPTSHFGFWFQFQLPVDVVWETAGDGSSDGVPITPSRETLIEFLAVSSSDSYLALAVRGI